MQPADPSALSGSRAEASGLLSWLRVRLSWIAMAVGFLYLGVFGLLVTLICGTLSFILPKGVGRRFGRQVHHQIFRGFVAYLRMANLVKADLGALDELRKISHPIIVAPNHSALWDAVFIIARVPQAVCVMKKSILANPFWGGGSRLAGYIPNGSGTGMIRDASETLSQGGQLLLFPEATRTLPTARWINPLKGGCALIAIRSKAPIHPVFIRSDSRYLQKGWPIFKPPVFPVRFSIELGEPIIPREGESAAELTSRLQAVYEQELARPHPLRRQIDS